MTKRHEENRKPLLVMLGPTAVGKTTMSLPIAKRFDCEIVSGDSMQVYRGMDIGTAKASPREMGEIAHHLIDIRNPDQPFSVSEYQTLAAEAIQQIHVRGKLPFIVGGTGLYIQSVCYDFDFTEGGADEHFRQTMRQYAEQHGAEALLERLRDMDPDTADRLHSNDQRRIIRALEIVHLTGMTVSEQLRNQNGTSPYNLCLIGLTMDRKQLYRRIEQRIELMLDEGLIDEVRSLLDRGFPENMTSMQALGYKEIADYLQGRCFLDEAVYLLKRNSRRYAKRQLSWFRRMKHIHWIDLSDSAKNSENLRIISDIIAGKFMFDTEYTCWN